MHVRGIPKREEIGKGAARKILKKQWLKTSPIWWRTLIGIQETQWTLGRKIQGDPHRAMVVTLLKDKNKEENFEISHRKKKLIVSKGILMSDFSPKMMEGRGQWNDIYKVLKGSNC